MSNPNAMIYQWMISSANAYWLDFFLRRDANVLIWNYRGYGESEQSIFTPNHDPNQQKVDSERVLQFLVNSLKVKGEIEAERVRAQTNIERERDAAIEELRREFGGLAISAAEKVVKSTLDEEKNRELISSVLEGKYGE